MSGIAGVVHWHGRPASPVELRRMLEVIDHRGPDGLEIEVRGEAGLGYARLALGGDEHRRRQPAWLPDGSCGAVADARLYNRDELLGALDGVEWLRDPVSDAALILAGYELWGERLPSRLDGDFAFAIWDHNERRVVAARDPFGAKPLVYAAGDRSFHFGSEPKQLLVLPAVPVEPDERAVAEFLLDRVGARRRTFFRGVERLRAGHCLVARAGESRQRPYWEPRVEDEPPGASPEAWAERLRALLADAVERRLDVESPVCLELSGGLDSSSLVVSAAEVLRRGRRGPPRIATLSAVFPGREFDESPLVEAVAARVPFASHRISPLDDETVPDPAHEVWITDSPDADLAAAWKRMAGSVLSSMGARTLIAGTGGDELFWNPDYLPDLLAERRWPLALRYLFGRADRARPALGRGLAGLRRRVGRGLGAGPAAPHWIRPELLAGLDEEELGHQPHETARDLPAGQQVILDWLSEPRFRYVLEQNETRWSRQGVELRHPFLDRRLVELVVSTPVHVRAAMGGAVKSYLASALSFRLPRALRNTRRKADYRGYYLELVERSRRTIRAALPAGADWACARFVRPGTIRPLLERARGAESSWNGARPLWAVACLEVWLRQLTRYEMMGGRQAVETVKRPESA